MDNTFIFLNYSFMLSQSQLEIAKFYDAVAEQYDSIFGKNDIGHYVRQFTVKQYLMTFSPGQNILELNCGTGADALILAQQKISITGFDLSPRMIAIAKKKILSAKLDNFIDVRVLAIEDIDILSGKVYDGALSNFDGLNTFRTFHHLSEKLANLLKPGAVFFATLLNSWSIQKIMGAIKQLHFVRAFSRLSKKGETPHTGFSYHIYYHSPFSFYFQFRNHFSLEKIFSFGFLVPPYGHDNASSFIKNNIPRLIKVEQKIAGILPFNLIGDHFLIEMKRRP